MSPFFLIQFIAKAIVRNIGNLVGLGVGGEVMVTMGEEAWEAWKQKRTAPERQAEMQALANAPPDEVRTLITEVVRQVTIDQAEEIRLCLEEYLQQVSMHLRQALHHSPQHCQTKPDVYQVQSEDLVSALSSSQVSISATSELFRFETDGLGICSLSVSPCGNVFAIGNELGSIQLWSFDGEIQGPPLNGHRGPITSLAISPNSQMLLSGSEDGIVGLWDVITGEQKLWLQRHRAKVHGVAFSPDGHRFLSVGGSFRSHGQPMDCSVREWECDSGQRRRRLRRPMGPVCCVSYLKKRSFFLTGEWNHNIYLWNLKTKTKLRRYRGHTGPVVSVAVTADSRRLLSASTDQTLRLWDIASGKELRRLEGHGDWITSAALSPDGQFAVSGSQDKTVRLWDLDKDRALRCYLGHEDDVTCVAFCPGGMQFLSGSKDGTLRLWSV